MTRASNNVKLTGAVLVALAVEYVISLEDEPDTTCLLQTEQVVWRPNDTEADSALIESGSEPSNDHNASSTQQASSWKLGKYYRQTMENHFNGLQYVAEIHMGDQRIFSVLDTGSFELLVFSNKCQHCGNRAELYNSKRSPNYRHLSWNMTHSFGSGDADSSMAEDDLRIGPLFAPRQYFWEVYDADMPVIEFGVIQSVFGIGPPGVPQKEAHLRAKEDNVWLQAMKKSGGSVPEYAEKKANDSSSFASLMDKKQSVLEAFNTTIFSICLLRGPSDPGYLTWNDEDPSKKPQLFSRVPVIGQVHWSVKLHSVELSNRKGYKQDIGCSGSGCAAIIDSGTSLIAAPPSVVERVKAEMHKLNSDCSNLDVMPDLRFKLGDEEFVLPPDSYIGNTFGELPKFMRPWFRTLTHSRRCELLLMSIDATSVHGPLWILGMPFFREYYTTFSLGKNHSERAIYTARAGQECTPEPVGGARNFHMNVKRFVDLSKIYMPHWMRRFMLHRFPRI